jgi:hypothetical protein
MLEYPGTRTDNKQIPALLMSGRADNGTASSTLLLHWGTLVKPSSTGTHTDNVNTMAKLDS